MSTTIETTPVPAVSAALKTGPRWIWAARFLFLSLLKELDAFEGRTQAKVKVS